MVVQLLGPVSLEVDGRRQAITSRATRSLLACLALRARKHVTADVLTDWVWGEDDLPENPGPALQTVVSRLRRTLREAGSSATVEAISGGYVLRLPPEDVDALRFESQVAQARQAAHRNDPERAVAHLDEALGLWDGGQALIDVAPSLAATGEAVRLDELRLDALHDRIELLLALRPPVELLADLARLTSHHPLREGFARQHMIALDSCGRRADALEVYRRLAHTMNDELGLGPGPETRAMQADLLAERPLRDAASSPRPPTATPRPAPPDTGPQDAAPATHPATTHPATTAPGTTQPDAIPADTSAPAVPWPVRVGTPPALAAAFQVRSDLRARIEAAQAGDAEAVVVTQVMSGDGGVGKTQLAADLFYDALDSGVVDLGVWVTATSRDAVLAAYAAAYKIVQPARAGAVHQEVEERAAAFLAWLAGTERTWMVVLDDVADPADLNQLRPRGRTGRVIVTTRRRDAAMTALGSIVDVALFSPEESLAYLEERLRQPHLPSGVLDDAAELASELGHLPLALAQAGAVIINDAITCADYRALLADRTLSLAEVFPLDPRASGDDYAHALPAAWSLATERAAGTDPLVRSMLAVVAVLDPNGIPESVLLAPSVIRHLGVAEDAAGSSGARLARSAIRTAHQFSLLTHAANDHTRSVRMHALAQRAALEHRAAGELAALVTTAADALIEVWPDIVADPDLAQVLRTNTNTLISRHPGVLWHPDVHAVVLRAGYDLGLSGQVSQAIAYHSELLARARTVLGDDHETTLRIRHQLADWRGKAGDLDGTIRAFENLLADQVRILGPDHRDTLITRYELAGWRGDAGDVAAAAEELQRLISDSLRALGPDDWPTLCARHDWAYWLGETGDDDGALRAYEDLHRDVLRILGPDHQTTLGTRHFLARARGRAGDPGAAATELEALLDDAVRVLGPDNPYTLTTRNSLAHWRGHAGDADAACDDLKALLADLLRVLGPDHLETLDARHEYAHWQGERGDLTGAVGAYRNLLTDTLRILGPEHPRTVTVRSALTRWETTTAASATGSSVVDLTTAQLTTAQPSTVAH